MTHLSLYSNLSFFSNLFLLLKVVLKEGFFSPYQNPIVSCSMLLGVCFVFLLCLQYPCLEQFLGVVHCCQSHLVSLLFHFTAHRFVGDIS